MSHKCDGETIFGFTVKTCDQEATHINVRNGVHEYYNFCERHYQHYLHGSEPLAGSAQDGDIIDVRYGDQSAKNGRK